MRRIVVVTTFSEQGWKSYAKRMVQSFDAHWPKRVELICYPDVTLADPVKSDRIDYRYPEIGLRSHFMSKYRHVPLYNGRVHEPYNYRFDVVKFCHKPFVLHHFATTHKRPADALIWLDADTVTHEDIPWHVVDKKMCPRDQDVGYLGRRDKYSECGFIYFNLTTQGARACIGSWVSFYATDAFKDEREWHDSYLFDRARERLEATGQLRAKSYSDFPRRKGGGHPFVNSFLGQYLDHLKGDARKRTGKPRPQDNYVGHKTAYWQKHGRVQ